MTPVKNRTSWRGTYVAALNVLAQAAARLSVGARDPILSGASAVELYTGSLWSMPDLELVCTDAVPLMTELFISGFRWVQRPRHVRRVLWRPELRMGINLAERIGSFGVEEQANSLVVAIDLGLTEQLATEPFSLKIVGIEDLILEQVGGWLRDGAGPGEAAAKLQALIGLAEAGVGRSLRVGYLQPRLASETDGEVTFESFSGDEAGEPPRNFAEPA